MDQIDDITILQTFPHNSEAYTQGLLIHQGELFESTGLYGQSSLRKVELATGAVLNKISLDSQWFAEGLTLFDNRLYQLTWRENTGFIYDVSTFEQSGTFDYQTEGWGLTQDGTHLIMSDGSSTLYFLDPHTRAIIKTLEVRQQNCAVTRLNELEYVEGEIWANVWQTDFIVRIDHETGNVLGWINLQSLWNESLGATAEVLNGIAYDPDKRTLLVTGKRWNKLFEIRKNP
ncbi:MAG: glutaminyl-peptide cyclotransferase [SAR324 cluster bacterium]|nr:glutaminyl-peptide cyclotransferase [SAR324 cluster bacterium]